ncbi:Phospholipase A1-Igamma2, chloroplastic [Ancistrocladus abbreviatus]
MFPSQMDSHQIQRHKVTAELKFSKGEDRSTVKERRSLADTWKKIHGQDDWDGMLDPIDSLLPTELIRYGEMAQACYDAFNAECYSKHCGNCRYEPKQFFQCLGLAQYGYEVTRYLYATCDINLPKFFKKPRGTDEWSQTANWVGYVAVSNDEASAYPG